MPVNLKSIKSLKIRKANSIYKGLTATFYDSNENPVYQMSLLDDNASVDSLRDDLMEMVDSFIAEHGIQLKRKEN